MRARLLLSGSIVAAALLVNGDPAAAGGGGCAEPPPTAPVVTATVAMARFCFEPGVIAVAPGETVEIVNEDPMLHNLYGPDWFHGDLAPGETATRAFDEVGTYTFACTLHPGMAGAVVVSDAQPISATSSVAGDEGDGVAVVLVGVGLALFLGLGAGGIFGWLAHRRTAATG